MQGSELGEKLKSYVEHGKLVPNELGLEIMLKGMLEVRSKRYLIDGFPREVDQSLFFESKILEF